MRIELGRRSDSFFVLGLEICASFILEFWRSLCMSLHGLSFAELFHLFLECSWKKTQTAQGQKQLFWAVLGCHSHFSPSFLFVSSVENSRSSVFAVWPPCSVHHSLCWGWLVEVIFEHKVLKDDIYKGHLFGTPCNPRWVHSLRSCLGRCLGSPVGRDYLLGSEITSRKTCERWQMGPNGLKSFWKLKRVENPMVSKNSWKPQKVLRKAGTPNKC